MIVLIKILSRQEYLGLLWFACCPSQGGSRMGWVVGLTLAGAEETGPPPSLTAPGPQLQPHVTSNRRITFSRPMTAPLTTLSPGNALPPPAPGALGAFPFRAPCLPSVPDLKTRVPDWAKCFCFQVSPFWALEEGFGVGACRASRVLGTVHRTDEACCCHRPRGIHTSSWEALLQSLRFSVFFNQ